MKKILTIATIAIFAVNFANASTLKGGNTNTNAKVKTTHVKYVKLSAKEFSVKNMQDTKDILMQTAPVASANGNTTTVAFAGR